MPFGYDKRKEIAQNIIGESLCFGALVVQKSSASNSPKQ
jgi:hypothetical protein